MNKKIISIVLLLFVTITIAQKSQRIAYIDMEYILNGIPQYIKAQNSLEAKVEKWKTELNKGAREIEVLKTDLANEKAILTKDLIAEREEDILIKQTNVRKLELLYFGPEGNMYTMRKQLVQPVQDQVYNAVQTIAKRKKYDFVFDKSGDLVMLYSNKKHDISKLVIKLIKIDQKKQSKADKIAEKKELLLSEAQKKAKEKKAAKKKKNQTKREARILAQQKKLKLLQQKRAAQKKRREEKSKKENNK